MSLISDALKKAQEEREGREPGDMAIDMRQDRELFPRKRLIFYGGLLAVVIIVVLAATVFFKPTKISTMQARNIRPNSMPAVGKNQAAQQQPETQAAPATQTVGQQPESTPAQQQTQNPIAQARDIQKQKSMEQQALTQHTPVKTTPAHSTTAQTVPQATTKSTTKSTPKSTPKVKPEKTSTPPPQREGTDTVKTRVARTATFESSQKKRKPTPAITKKPNAPIDAKTLIQQGNGFMKESKYANAVDAYKKALEMEKSPGIYLKLYGAFKAMKNPVLTRAYIDDGLRHFPDDFYLNKVAAILYIRAKDFRKALVNADRAIAKNANDYTLFTYRGLCYFHTGNYNNAIENFKQSLNLNSDAVENYYYTGLIFDNRKEYEKALHYYNAFFKLNPEGKNFKHTKWIRNRMRNLNAYLDQ